MKIIKVLSHALFIYGFAGWVYIAFNAVFHMETLAMPLTHLLPFPREDTFGIICFGVSFVSFIIWKYLEK
jgi:hypothetical protein